MEFVHWGESEGGGSYRWAVASERREWPRNIVEDGGQKSPFTGPPRGHQPCPWAHQFAVHASPPHHNLRPTPPHCCSFLRTNQIRCPCPASQFAATFAHRTQAQLWWAAAKTERAIRSFPAPLPLASLPPSAVPRELRLPAPEAGEEGELPLLCPIRPPFPPSQFWRQQFQNLEFFLRRGSFFFSQICIPFFCPVLKIFLLYFVKKEVYAQKSLGSAATFFFLVVTGVG
jgi:hypothetical protein